MGETNKTTALADRATEAQQRRDLLTALRRGDVKGIVKLEDDPERLASMLVQLRRRNVATLGDHEAFVRHVAGRGLRQVLRPCKLSVHDGTLYQIKQRRKIVQGSQTPDNPLGTPHNGNGRWDWIDIPTNEAMITYQGLMRINETVGCHLVQPKMVVVDGKERVNPYVQRTEGKRGRLGDIVRVVVGVVVIGPAPGTGNPVAVAYVLDYDPTKELLHMLANLAEFEAQDCKLQDEDDPVPPGWKYTDVYGGVGYAYNLGSKKVRKAYRDFINLLQNAVKKAQTVARRNALKSHPAFGGWAKVIVGNDGTTRIPVIGWTSDDAAHEKLDALTRRVSQGRDLDSDIDLVEIENADIQTTVTEDYSPEEHATTAAEDEATVVEEPASPPEEEDERGLLLDQIRQGLAILDGDGAVDYDPEGDAEHLRETLARINTLIDSME